VRLFVAAYPPAAVREDFARLVRDLGVGQPRPPGRSVRLAPADQWHITLAFLGDVPEARQGRVIQAVDAAAEGCAPATVRIAGGGTFGRGRFTVLWAGLRGEVDLLLAAGVAVRRELKRAKLTFDPKPLRAHVTVARPGDRISAEERATDLAALAAYEGPEWTVDEIRLMRSHLGPKPTYDIVHSRDLGHLAGS
jgi:2'-5' RNA ligase